MDEEKQPRMTVLDQMLAEDHLQMLKAAIPYLPFQAQRALALYSKLLELQHTATLFSAVPEMHMMEKQPDVSGSFQDMLEDLSQYVTGDLHGQLENLTSALAAVSMFQTMQDTIE